MRVTDSLQLALTAYFRNLEVPSLTDYINLKYWTETIKSLGYRNGMLTRLKLLACPPHSKTGERASERARARARARARERERGREGERERERGREVCVPHRDLTTPTGRCSSEGLATAVERGQSRGVSARCCVRRTYDRTRCACVYQGETNPRNDRAAPRCAALTLRGTVRGKQPIQ